jgi:hypothetical protein
MARGGKREGAGRPRGSLNKNNQELRDMILAALAEKGGVQYLAEKADSHPQAFMSLLGRVLPMAVEGPGDEGEHKIVVSWLK